MQIYKIIALALAVAMLCFYLKSINSEFYMLAMIAGGVLILICALNYLSATSTFFRELANNLGVDDKFITVILKITIVAYLFEFSASLIDDFGMKSLAEKLVFVGKIALFCLSIPLFKGFAEIILQFLS